MWFELMFFNISSYHPIALILSTTVERQLEVLVLLVLKLISYNK